MSEPSNQELAKNAFRYERGESIIYDRFPKQVRLLFAGCSVLSSFIPVLRVTQHHQFLWILLTLSTLFTIAMINGRFRLILDPKAKRIVKEFGVRPFSKVTEIPWSDLQSIEVHVNESGSASGEISLLLQIRIGWSSTNWCTPSILEGTSLDKILIAAERDAALFGVPVILSEKVTQLLPTSGSSQRNLTRRT